MNAIPLRRSAAVETKPTTNAMLCCSTSACQLLMPTTATEALIHSWAERMGWESEAGAAAAAAVTNK